jgi:hypothetical protein
MLNEMVVWIVRLDKNEKMGLSLEKKVHLSGFQKKDISSDNARQRFYSSQKLKLLFLYFQ